MLKEQVLVINRDLLDNTVGTFQGFYLGARRHMDTFMAEGNNFFMDREEAEKDPTHKQIIPYVLFRQENRYLIYTRGSKSGEQRLAAKKSVGIGGHINPCDARAEALSEATYFAAVEREIGEELSITGNYDHRCAGLINDDSNEVGKVHLGLVHICTLEKDAVVTSNEDAIQDVRFLTISELVAEMPNLESWSQICVQRLVIDPYL